MRITLLAAIMIAASLLVFPVSADTQPATAPAAPAVQPSSAANAVPAAPLAPAPSPASPLLAEARKAIDQGNANYIKAWETADANLMADQFDVHGCTFARHGAVYQGRDQVRRYHQYVMAAGAATSMTITTQEIWIVGDIAYETGKYTLTFPNGEALAGHYVTTWKRQRDHGWKIWTDMGVPGD